MMSQSRSFMLSTITKADRFQSWQCYHGFVGEVFTTLKTFNDAFDTSIDWTNERMGKWTAVEDSKLKDAVQTHGGKNWSSIAKLVPGRTRNQCSSRWKEALTERMHV
jgi:hypothetical protein